MSLVELIELPKEEYEALKRKELQLQALEQSGVDNWEWYGEHYKRYAKLLKLNNLTDPDLDEEDDDETDQGCEE